MDTYKNMGEFQMHCAKPMKRASKGYILYDCIYMIYWKRQNYRKGKQISCCQLLGLQQRVDCKGMTGGDLKMEWKSSVSYILHFLKCIINEHFISLRKVFLVIFPEIEKMNDSNHRVTRSF